MKRARTSNTRAIEAVAARLETFWADALRLESVGRDEDFFKLGGDSLAALVIAGAVQETFAVEIAPEIFESARTVGLMAQLVSDAMAQRKAAATRPDAPVGAVEAPLTLAQETIWRHVSGENPEAYVIPGSLAIDGAFDIATLQAAIERVVRRHSILRTVFRETNGGPRQYVLPSSTVALELIDVSAAEDREALFAEHFQRALAAPFDLEHGPLMTFTVLRVASDEHRVIALWHHLIFDAWSARLFWEEVGAAMAGADAPPPPAQYADFALWQRASLDDVTAGRLDGQLERWRVAIREGLPALRLPFERDVEDPGASAEDSQISIELDDDVARRLDAVGVEVGVTFFVLRLAAYAAHLTGETGVNEHMIGTYVAGRPVPQVQTTIGAFADLAVLLLRMRGELTFRAWLAEVRSAVLDLQAVSDVSFNYIADRLASEGLLLPEPTQIFSVYDEPIMTRLGPLDIRTPEIPRAYTPMPWGFSLRADRRAGEDRVIRAHFDTRKYDPAAVRSFLERFCATIDAASAEPDRPLSAILDASGPASRRNA